MALFTPDVTYIVYMNGSVIAEVSGTENMEKDFSGHASQVKSYFTLNGQHTVKIDGDTATGISFSQIKMIRDSEVGEVITDYSVRYDDTYVGQAGKWLIKARVGHFIIIEARPFNR